jgi:hypothetical protein
MEVIFCSKCNQEKPIEQYRLRKNRGKYIRGRICISCVSLYDLTRKKTPEYHAIARKSQAKARKKNHETIRDYERKYWAKVRFDPEDREKRRLECKASRERLVDSYVISLLKSNGFEKDSITPSLIKAWRAIRLIKKEVERG